MDSPEWGLVWAPHQDPPLAHHLLGRLHPPHSSSAARRPQLPRAGTSSTSMLTPPTCPEGAATHQSSRNPQQKLWRCLSAQPAHPPGPRRSGPSPLSPGLRSTLAGGWGQRDRLGRRDAAGPPQAQRGPEEQEAPGLHGVGGGAARALAREEQVSPCPCQSAGLPPYLVGQAAATGTWPHSLQPRGGPLPGRPLCLWSDQG